MKHWFARVRADLFLDASDGTVLHAGMMTLTLVMAPDWSSYVCGAVVLAMDAPEGPRTLLAAEAAD